MAGLHLVMALSFGIVAAGPPGAAKQPTDLVLDFTSDFKGNIEKCG